MTERADTDRLRLSTADTPAAVARAEQVASRLAAVGVGAEVVVCPGGGGDPTGRVAALVRVRDGGADAAVHGGDELPVELPDGLVVAATPARIDPRDALVSRSGWGLAALPRDRPVSVAVSGAGRRAQLQRQRRDLVLSHGAAALEERLAAVERGDLDAVVVGLAELLLARPPSTSLVVVPLEHGEVLHRPGQGTTVVTCARSAASTRKILARLEDATTRAELDAERELWRQLSQDDDPLVGAHAETRVSAGGQPRLVLLGLRTDATGSRSARASHETAPDEAVTLGRAMAVTLLEATATPDAHVH